MRTSLTLIFFFPLSLFAKDTVELTHSDIYKIFLMGSLLIISLFVIFILYIRTNRLKNHLDILTDRFENMFKKHDAIMLLIEPQSGKIIDVNKSALKFYGFTYQEFLSKHIQDINTLSSDELKRKREEANALKTNRFEFPHKLKDGTIKSVEVHSTPIDTENGVVLFSIIEDITEEKRLQEEVLTQKNEFESIFNYSQDGIAIVNLDTQFLNFNNAFLNMTGFTRDELLKKNCKELTAPEDLEKNEEAVKEAIENGHCKNYRKDCIVKDGKRVTVSISISLLPDKQRLLLTLKDMTAFKIIEQQTKLASMGEMIGNIAHQWRQPLSVITSCASALKVKSELSILEKDDINKGVEDIVKQSTYLSNTIDNFRNFIKGEKNDFSLSIKELIQDTLSLTSASLDNNYIKLHLNIDDDINIHGNKSELTEAFINIINNSKDVLRNKKEKDRFLFISTEKIDNKKLEVKILDSGDGIPEDIVDKIFEPYFTTKHQSQGTGLGLAMVDKIIRDRHKGVITVSNKDFEHNNRKFRGACIKIVFEAN